MTISSDPRTSAPRATPVRPDAPLWSERDAERQLSRWGGRAAVAGVIFMVGAVAVVVGLGLPDASDVETLTDFADIETGRIFEHFLYLGALMLFALHVMVLQRLLKIANPAAALFGTTFAAFGLVIMAASSILHIATSPLAELYTSPETPPEDLRSIEYAWYGAQSVFDTMLVTGVLLVPIGIALLGVAMRSAPAFGPRLAWTAIVLGAVGTIGATIEIIDRDLELSAVSVLAIVLFQLTAGVRTLKLGNESSVDIADEEPTLFD